MFWISHESSINPKCCILSTDKIWYRLSEFKFKKKTKMTKGNFLFSKFQLFFFFF